MFAFEVLAAEQSAREERLKARRELVNIGVDFSPTALVQAVRENDALVVELLVEGGVDVNLPDAEGVPALVLAAREGRSDLMRLLLDSGANPSAADRDGGTALHRAANLDIRIALVAAGADVRARGSNGETPLHSAVFNHWLAAAHLYLKHGASVKDVAAPLHLALLRNSGRLRYTNMDVEMVRLLLDSGADANEVGPSGESALALAAGKVGAESGEIAALLVGHGANVDYGGSWRPIFRAVFMGSADTVQVLLDAGAELALDDRGENLIYSAMRTAYDCAKGGYFHGSVEACEQAAIEVISALLRAGIEPNKPAKDGSTALDWLRFIDGPFRAGVDAVFADHGWATNGP